MNKGFEIAISNSLKAGIPSRAGLTYPISISAQQSRHSSSANNPPMSQTASGAGKGASAARAQASGVDRDQSRHGETDATTVLPLGSLPAAPEAAAR